MGVASLEIFAEVAGDGSGGSVAQVLGDDFGGHVGVAGADEDVVYVIGAEEDFGVAEHAGGFDVEAVLGEDGADEGAEVGGGIDEQDAVAALLFGDLGGGFFEEGLERGLFGGVDLEDGVEHGLLQEVCDEM